MTNEWESLATRPPVPSALFGVTGALCFSSRRRSSGISGKSSPGTGDWGLGVGHKVLRGECAGPPVPWLDPHDRCFLGSSPRGECDGGRFFGR
jgi:hypothetical protein